MSTNYQKLENNEDQNKYKSSQKLQMFQIQLKHMWKLLKIIPENIKIIDYGMLSLRILSLGVLLMPYSC